jgi:hypothetical protein
MLHSTPPTSLWLELTKIILGPLIAASTVIVGLLWRDRIERRNAAQSWYEQTYIAEGLDVIISHLAVLCHSVSEGRRVMTDMQITPLPSAVSRRLFSFQLFDFLSGVETAEAVILASARNDHPVELTEDESAELLAFCIGLAIYADTIRVFLLDKTIKVKSDVYKIPRDPKFVALVNDLQNNFIENAQLKAMHLVLQTKYRPRIVEAARALKVSKQQSSS